jgi:NhaP-type Na+/H+ or K+/H+ antiporter
MVFGESLLNDGVAVVIYDMMLVFVGLEDAGQEVSVWQVGSGLLLLLCQVIMGVLSFFSVAGGGLLIGVIFGVLTALLTRQAPSLP